MPQNQNQQDQPQWQQPEKQKWKTDPNTDSEYYEEILSDLGDEIFTEYVKRK